MSTIQGGEEGTPTNPKKWKDPESLRKKDAEIEEWWKSPEGQQVQADISRTMQTYPKWCEYLKSLPDMPSSVIRADGSVDSDVVVGWLEAHGRTTEDAWNASWDDFDRVVPIMLAKEKREREELKQFLEELLYIKEAQKRNPLREQIEKMAEGTNGKKICSFVLDHPGATITEIRTDLQMTKDTVKNALRQNGSAWKGGCRKNDGSQGYSIKPI